VRTITNCRACESNKLIDVVDLGEQYLSDFREDDTKPPKYPLEVVMCKECKLVQLRHTTPSHEMYHERYGFKSGVNDTIKNDLESIVKHALMYKPKNGSWLDIASNDGTLLSFVPKGWHREGTDPIGKLCKQAEAHADRIVNDFYKKENFEENQFDVITSISMFYDLDDPNKFVKEVRHALKENGVWIIQQNYLLTTLMLNAVDNICHEHLEYYSLLSLENLLNRYDLEVNEVTTSMINGGSFRTVVSRKGTYPISPSVQAQRDMEKRFGLEKPSVYKRFGEIVKFQLAQLRDFVDEINGRGEEVYIYGASTRGGTIWQGAGLDVNDLPKAVERNPEKVGKKIAAIGVPIISEEQAREEHPKYMLVSPWFFKEEFVKREAEYINTGGTLIFPLPLLELVGPDTKQ